MPVVGTLVVDLTANTASFSGDLGKASRSAEDFGKSAAAAGDKTTYSMMEAKGSMMLLGEELGVHIPRHLQTLIAEIPMIGAAFSAMLPIVGVVAAIAIISKLVEKNAEAKEKFTHDWEGANNAIQDVFAKLDDKLLEAAIKADELSGNSLAALALQLQKIDNASMRELVTELGTITKAADHVFEDLKSHWYELGGGEEAKKKLDAFKDQYEALIRVGNKTGAADLLTANLKDANEELKKAQTQNAYGVTASEKMLKGDEERLRVLQGISTLQDKAAQVVKLEKEDKTAEFAEKGARAQEKLAKLVSTAHKELAKELEAGYTEEGKIAQEQLNTQMKERVKDAAEKFKLAEEGSKNFLAMADEQFSQTERIGRLQQEADSEETRHKFAMHEGTAAQIIAAEAKDNNAIWALEKAGYDKRIEILLQFGDKYKADITKLNNLEKAAETKHLTEMAKLTHKGEEDKLRMIQDAEGKVAHAIASTAAQSIISGHNMAAAFEQMGKQMSEVALTNLMEMETIAGRAKLVHAKGAAQAAFHSVMDHVPEPFAAALAPIAAGAAFAGVMSFEQGGKIPGSGPVPITAHGGETAVSRVLTDRVEASEGRGKGRSVTIVQNLTVKDADSFKSSQSQLQSKAFHAATTAAKRNR